MLDLHAGIHFHEIETAIIIQQKFHRARVGIADRLGGNDGQATDILALRFIELRRWRDFDQFLIAALNRAVTFIQVNDITVVIGEDLHFDMPWIDDTFFQKHIGAAKRFGRLGNNTHIITLQFFGVIAAPYTASATTGSRFQHDGIADSFSNVQCFFN